MCIIYFLMPSYKVRINLLLYFEGIAQFNVNIGAI